MMIRTVGMTVLAVMIGGCCGTFRSGTMLSDGERSDGFVSLFDGKTLDGWRYEPKFWSVTDGVIVGDTHPDAPANNSCAIYEKPFGDLAISEPFYQKNQFLHLAIS